MSLRKSVARFLVVFASVLVFSINATQTRAQSQGENANPNVPLYKTTSIKPSTSSGRQDKTQILPRKAGSCGRDDEDWA